MRRVAETKSLTNQKRLLNFEPTETAALLETIPRISCCFQTQSMEQSSDLHCDTIRKWNYTVLPAYKQALYLSHIQPARGRETVPFFKCS